MLSEIAPWNTHWTGAPVSDLVQTHPGKRAFTPHWTGELLGAETWRLAPGPRQVGKTNAFGHVIEDLIERGVPSRHIAYVPMEQHAVQAALHEKGWDHLVQAFSDLHVPSPERPLYLLLDEIQTVPKWPERLVALYNRHRIDVRLLATGSSAVRLKDLQSADFPGRLHVLPVYPMKFREVLEHHPDRPLEVFPTGHVQAHIQDARESLAEGDWHRFVEVATSLAISLHANPRLKGKIQSILDEYLIWGGYPRLRPGSPLNRADRLQLLDQYWNSVLAKDLLPRGKARKIQPLSWLFERLALRSPTTWDPAKLHDETGADPATLRSWLDLFVDAMLIQPLPRLTNSLGPSPKADRLVLLDPVWRTYAAKTTDPVRLQEEGTHGRMAEAVLVDHARRMAFNVLGHTTARIGYLADPEVDLVLPLGGLTLLIECKYRTQTTSARKNLQIHLERGRDRRGVVVTRDHLDHDKEIFWCPLAVILLIC